MLGVTLGVGDVEGDTQAARVGIAAGILPGGYTEPSNAAAPPAPPHPQNANPAFQPKRACAAAVQFDMTLPDAKPAVALRGLETTRSRVGTELRSEISAMER